MLSIQMQDSWRTRAVGGASVVLFMLTLSGCLNTEEPTDGSKSSNGRLEVSKGTAEQQYAPPLVSKTGMEDLLGTFEKSRGNVIVINFWATWCVPCVAEMPEFVKFYEGYRSKSVVFLSVCLDDPEVLEERIKPFVEKHRLPFPVDVIEASSPDEIIDPLGVEWEGTLPATFIYDQKGELRKSWIGPVTLEDLKETVEPLLQANSTEHRGASSEGSST